MRSEGVDLIVFEKAGGRAFDAADDQDSRGVVGRQARQMRRTDNPVHCLASDRRTSIRGLKEQSEAAPRSSY